MSTRELRLSITSLLDQTEDTEIMQSILILLRKSLATSAPDIVAFEPDGQPISDEELVESILMTREDILAGNTISLEEMKKICLPNEPKV